MDIFFSRNAFTVYGHLTNVILYNTLLTTGARTYCLFLLKTFNTFNNNIYKQSMIKYNVTKMQELKI